MRPDGQSRRVAIASPKKIICRVKRSRSLLQKNPTTNRWICRTVRLYGYQLDGPFRPLFDGRDRLHQQLLDDLGGVGRAVVPAVAPRDRRAAPFRAADQDPPRLVVFEPRLAVREAPARQPLVGRLEVRLRNALMDVRNDLLDMPFGRHRWMVPISARSLGAAVDSEHSHS